MTWMTDNTGKQRKFPDNLVEAKEQGGWVRMDPQPEPSKQKIITVDEPVVLHMVDTVNSEPEE